MMRTTILVLFVVLAVASARHVLDAELVDLINSNPSTTWKAGLSPRFKGMTIDEVKSMLSHLPRTSKSAAPMKTYAAPRAVPDSFDARREWDTCVGRVRDQGDCGSGWAFGAVEVLGDRFCIATGGRVDVELSAQSLISCDADDSGCDGGYLNVAWQYLFVSGVVSEQCYPYSSTNGELGACRTSCLDGSAYTTFRAATNYQLFGEATIQSDIAQNGPVEAAFSVFEDFVHYEAGVYSHVNGTYLGDHAVKIIGWGVDTASGSEYWLAQNSWGTSWGDNGLFKIARGQDECGIEDSVYAGLPAVSSASLKRRK